MLSKSCIYAVRSVLYLALHSKDEKNFGVQALSEALDIPRHFLGKVLQNLVREGYISSVKGPGGGFFMTSEQTIIPIFDIIVFMDGQEPFMGCVLGLPSCDSDNPCPLHSQIYAFREGIRLQFENHTIAQLTRLIETENIII